MEALQGSRVQKSVGWTGFLTANPLGSQQVLLTCIFQEPE